MIQTLQVRALTQQRPAGSSARGRVGSGGLAARCGQLLGDVAIQQMDNVAVVVDDLDAAVAFFTELGMEYRRGGPAA